VTEIVQEIETRDANKTATGTVKKTGTETGIAIDGTLACHSLDSIPSVIADNFSCFLSQFEAGAGVVAITGNLRAASDAVTCASIHLQRGHLPVETCSEMRIRKRHIGYRSRELHVSADAGAGGSRGPVQSVLLSSYVWEREGLGG
jgi:hypothetical protein